MRLLTIAITIISFFLFTVSSNNTYEEAKRYAMNHPNRSGGISWKGRGASLMWQCGNFPDTSYKTSPISAFKDSHIVNNNFFEAPSGAFHWWDDEDMGHVAMATTSGWGLMAYLGVAILWGKDMGLSPVGNFTEETHFKYKGWSYDFAGSEIKDVHKNDGFPQTITAITGVPDFNYYKRFQLFARNNGYTGPIDGYPGTFSWAGVQRGLRAYGYEGPDDGIPGKFTFMAIQRCGIHYGYNGPVDGELGPESYKGFAKFLNTL
jgi:hypothetical protein